MKENVYVNSDPADLSALKKFIENHAPFDIVMDGLNVSYHDNKIDESPIVMVGSLHSEYRYL